MKTAESDEGEDGRGEQPVAPNGDQPSGSRVVLYVEDNPSNVRLVERVLARRSGVSLLVATRGSVGLELARRHRPDLVLLDLNLPDLPGAVVLERLRAEPLTRDIPVVVISADATPQQQERLKAAGVADYLTKPFDIERLLAIVEGLARPGLAEPPVGTPPPADRGAVLDPAVLDRLRALEEASGEPLGDLVALFVDDGGQRLGVLQAALAAGDADTIGRVAHGLKGTSANYGAHELPDLCDRLGLSAAAGDLRAAAELVVRVAEEFEQVAAALRQEFPYPEG
jgi:CheY-like chemotaxis protein